MNDYPLYTNDVFSISPVAKRAYLEAGESYPGILKITNPIDAENTLHYQVSVSPYSVVGEEYEADFSSETTYTDIAKWITIENPTGYIEPNNTTVVNYTINVPEDAPGGGYYCALTVRSLAREDNASSDEGVAVNDVLEIASVVYAQVNGEIRREGEILDNYIPGFTLENLIKTSATLKNTGNVHQDAKISLKATSALTGRTYYINDTSEDEGDTGEVYTTEVIMPETTRYTTQSITGLPAVGVFNITQEISFNGKINLKEQTVFLCPIWFICVVLGLIMFTVFAIVVRRPKAEREAQKIARADKKVEKAAKKAAAARQKSSK